MVAVIAEVVDGHEVEWIDAEVAGRGGDADRGDHRLVDMAGEPDVEAIAPQAVLTDWGPADAGHAPDPEPDRAVAVVVLQELPDCIQIAADTLVSVEREDPVAGGEVERAVARGGEVVLPGLARDQRTVLLGHRDRAVRRSGVHDDDLVDEAAQRGQARVQMIGVVLDDDRGRQQHRTAVINPGTGR